MIEVIHLKENENEKNLNNNEIIKNDSNNINNSNLTIINENNSNVSYYNFLNPLFKNTPICYIKIENVKQLKESLNYAINIVKKRVSIRSGGHSCCNFSILNDTVNLDMSGLKDCIVDVENKIVKVQCGVTFLEYYKETSKYLLGGPGGSCPSVCLGGLSLGGGSNPLSIKHGYLLDNILEITILLENGKLVKANSSNQYSDLFWALRGAGHCSFGIALDFKIQLYDIQPYYYHNSIELSFDSMIESNEIIDEYMKTTKSKNNVYIGLDYRITIKSKRLTNILIFFYIGDLKDGENEFNKLFQLLMKTSSPRVAEMNSEKVKKTFLEIVERVPYSNKTRRSFTKCRFSKDLNKKNSMLLKEIMELAPIIINKMIVPDAIANFSSTIYYHGGIQNQLPKDNCSFIHRGDDCTWSYTFICLYTKEENDQIFKEWKTKINSFLNFFGNQIYQNYPDDECTNWQSSYYGDHYPKLQQIKKKYDPKNYFKYQQSIELPK
ncbi:hypothetical protein RB653_000651 [Dictyostelium firmibasis]|uniref:FAD-binding PCMH-type domain-containing protein n=1 Tax=Dictyostelium firmibasis TaxID=79012 RepID=A0AAN7TVH5_9MYCE